MNFIDKFLNSITMYRLVLCNLLTLAGLSIIFGFTKIISFGGLQQLASLITLLTSCYIFNLIFAKIFKAKRGLESSFITALILFFIFIPISTAVDLSLLIAGSALAMASKYLLVFKKRHIFNPAAFGSFILILAGTSVSLWWVGSQIMLPFVTISGLLIVRKIHRFHLFFSYLFASLFAIIMFGLINHSALDKVFIQAFTSWPLIFFGTVMVTEPMTSPPIKKYQIIFGILVGVLFGSQFQIGPIYASPEFALIIGNLFAFLVSPQFKLNLSLKKLFHIA